MASTAVRRARAWVVLTPAVNDPGPGSMGTFRVPVLVIMGCVPPKMGVGGRNGQARVRSTLRAPVSPARANTS